MDKQSTIRRVNLKRKRRKRRHFVADSSDCKGTNDKKDIPDFYNETKTNKRQGALQELLNTAHKDRRHAAYVTPFVADPETIDEPVPQKQHLFHLFVHKMACL